MLAAAEALGNASAAGNYNRRLAFVALAGEPWGLMGSRRLLWQMHAGDPSVHGLRLDAVEQARRAAAHVLGHGLACMLSLRFQGLAGVTRHESSSYGHTVVKQHASSAVQAAMCSEREGYCAQVVELGQVGRARPRGGARTLFVHRQRGPEWGNGTQLAAAFKAAAAGAQGIEARFLAYRALAQLCFCDIVS